MNTDLNAERKRRAGLDPMHGHCPHCGELNIVCRIRMCDGRGEPEVEPAPVDWWLD